MQDGHVDTVRVIPYHRQWMLDQSSTHAANVLRANIIENVQVYAALAHSLFFISSLLQTLSMSPVTFCAVVLVIF